MPLRLGIELGASRAGFALADDATGVAHALKLPVVDGRLSATLTSGVSELLGRSNSQGGEIDRVVVALPPEVGDAAGLRVGLLVTRGFEQHLAQAGGPDQARLTRGVDERISASGNTLTQIDADTARQSVSELLALQIDAMAICLMQAHRNPEHELRLREIVRDLNAQLPVVLSHEISPESGEDARTRATLLAARATKGAEAYLTALADGLAGAEIRPPVDIMQSTGDRAGADIATTAPEKILAAGSASGAAAAARISGAAGYPDALSLDVGGGEAFGALIRKGRARIANATTLNGHLVNLPTIDLRALGGGVDSIATAPMAGMIRISGETGRPARLGRDGHPTILDALVTLRRLPVDTLSLDVDSAESAIADFARPLGLDVHRAAEGIVGIYCETLAGGLRRVAIEKGEAPERLALVASGGGGPMLACEVARIMGSGPVIVPRNAGILAAVGCATAGKATQFTASVGQPTDTGETDRVSRAIADLTERAEDWLSVDGEGGQILFRAELTYPRSQFRSSVAFEAEAAQDTAGLMRFLADRAADAWRGRFGNAPDEATDLTTIRAIATAKDTATPRPAASANSDSRGALEAQGQIWFDGGFHSASTYDGDKLTTGARVVGPALIRQSLTTIVVAPGNTATVDGHLNVIIRTDENGAGA